MDECPVNATSCKLCVKTKKEQNTQDYSCWIKSCNLTQLMR